MEKEIRSLSEVTVRFAGDSGDGMQLTGTQFSDSTAFAGNDLMTLPDYPSEIRAPAGTIAGVSGFQLHFSADISHTPGDLSDVLVAMNPAALKANLKDLKKGGIIIVNADAFTPKNLKLAEYAENPLEDDSLSGYKVHPCPITSQTEETLKDSTLTQKEKVRCKNFFALGIMLWLYSRPVEPINDWISTKFMSKPAMADANKKVLKSGYYFGDNTQLFEVQYEVKPAELDKGTYRNISGNEATAVGFVAAAKLANAPLFLGSYPITPATEILQYLSKYKNYGVKTFQAEDEIAGIVSSIGAAYGGHLAITTTSGPGLALKTEAIGLAVITELPLVIVNVQRGGPSTGLPTKTEQSDLLQSLWGRNGETPIPVIAAATPSDCFNMAIEAMRIAVKYMTPVILLTDGYIANGSEPWKIPDPKDLPEIKVEYATDPETYNPYNRNDLQVRPWAKPGTPGLEHKVGGLEKSNIYGAVSYDPENHQFMTRIRAQKIANIVQEVPEIVVDGDEQGDLLVLGWGGTYGAIRTAVTRSREEGLKVSQVHLKYLNPLPKNLGDILRNFKHVLIPELNMGQMARYLKSEYCVTNLQSLKKVKGLPFKAITIQAKISEILGGKNGN